MPASRLLHPFMLAQRRGSRKRLFCAPCSRMMQTPLGPVNNAALRPFNVGEQTRTIMAGANEREAHLRALTEQLQFSVETLGDRLR